MKKIFLFIVAVAAMNLTLHAQKCSCNPDGWRPFSVKINSTVQPEVRCGYQFSLKCRDTITLLGLFKCGGDCNARYIAVLKNSAGTIIQSYPNLVFPWWHAFATAGNYSLEITPVCGGLKCIPCKFFFTVTCNAPCTCTLTHNGWSPFTAYINSQPPQKVECGKQFNLTCRDTINLKGLYRCSGDCNATYIGILRKGTTIIQTISPFTFPWHYTFAGSGGYTLEIIPICNGRKCTPCKFSFKVSCAKCNCSIEQWRNMSIVVGRTTRPIECGATLGIKLHEPFQLNGVYNCKGGCPATYAAVLRNSSGMVVANFPSFNFPWSYTFPLTGLYKLSITPVCGSEKCKTCTFNLKVVL